MPLVKVEKFSVEFSVDGHWLPAVTDLSFQLNEGGVLALVGESGCGKSVTCMSLARLLPEPPARYASGTIRFTRQGKTLDVLSLNASKLRELRGGGIGYVFQEPSVSLNPVFRVGDQIAEALELHRPDVTDVRNEVISYLKMVGISDPASRRNAYPHELSGGMQQRVMIAMALASGPDLLVADEPTTALDVTIQAQILDLLRDIRARSNMAILLVTHNLGIVADLADDVLIMYAGHAVEEAPTNAILETPAHPYTKALLAAVPDLSKKGGALTSIPGSVPSPAKFPKGCRFFGRCPLAEKVGPEKRKRCAEEIPEWREWSVGRNIRCHHANQ